MDIQPLISIIVPVYNADKYLHKCLESLSGQNYKHIEVLVVDDGSTDGSGAICDEFAKHDKRFHVTHQKNSGVSAARNHALDTFRGDYLMFVDSDDWVTDDFCSHALELVQKHGVDMAVFGIQNVIEDPTNRHSVNKDKGVMATKQPRKIDSHEAMGHLIKRDEVYNYLTNKIFARRLFDGVRFPLGRTFEDNEVAYKTIHKAGELYLSDKVTYYYMRRPKSLSFVFYKPQSIRDRFEIWSGRLAFFEEHYPEHVEAQVRQLSRECANGLRYAKGSEYAPLRKSMCRFLDAHKSELKGSGSQFLKYYYTLGPLFKFYLALKRKTGK